MHSEPDTKKEVVEKKYFRKVEIVVEPTTRSQIKKLKGVKSYDQFLVEQLHLQKKKENI